MNERKNPTARVYTVCRLLLITLTAFIAACGSPEKSWEQAEREDSQTGYLEFLAKHPQGEFADQARNRIDELKEQRAWERAEFRDRAPNYERFIDLYPDSAQAPQARQRLLELERDQAWENASEADTAAALETFLATYPAAPQRDEAEKRLAAMTAAVAEPELPAEVPGDFRVQLGAFRTERSARTEAKRLSGRFVQLPIGPIDIVPPTTGGFHVLTTAPMDLVTARTLCDALRAADQDCLVINRDRSAETRQRSTRT